MQGRAWVDSWRVEPQVSGCRWWDSEFIVDIFPPVPTLRLQTWLHLVLLTIRPGIILFHPRTLLSLG